MNLLGTLEEDPIIAKYLSYYTTREKLDALLSTLLYGICSLKLHYNNPLPMTLLGETVRKAKAIYSTCATKERPARDGPVRTSLRSESLASRMQMEPMNKGENELLKRLNSAEWRQQYENLKRSRSSKDEHKRSGSVLERSRITSN